MADSPDTTSQPPITWAERWPGAIREPSRADGPIHLAEYDPAGPRSMSERRRGSVRCWATGSGCWSTPARRRSRGSPPSRSSTSSWRCADSADEPAYVPDLEAGGYVLQRPRARLVRAPAVQGPRHGRQPARLLGGSPEIDRTLAFRDRLRTRRRRSPAVRGHQARAGRPRLGLRPGLRRCQGRDRRGDPRAAIAAGHRPSADGGGPR